MSRNNVTAATFCSSASNTSPAEEAYLTAVAVAQQQKARSFELRAAVSLAKLYQATNRSVDAHAILAAALAGFAPTPEFPEIEEAQRLLAVRASSLALGAQATQACRGLGLF